MKKYFYLALAATTMAACTNDVDYSSSDQGNPNNTIGFQVLGRNSITRAQSLQDAGHYNFGVFAYKSTDNVNNVMSNYLVGYMDNANKKGYYMTNENQTTEGDMEGVLNGKSGWAYEMLGNKEYDYRGTDGYYTVDDAFYMSNVEKQYLKYWDLSAPTTNFYAYAPYINGANTVIYINGTKKMTFPASSIQAGYNDPSKFEFMYAAKEVDKVNYGHDVSLDFKRINAKVQIKFWEDIDGYSVRILDLSSTYNGVYAAPSKRTGSAGSYSYTYGKYVKNTGAVVDFTTIATPKVSYNDPVAYNKIAEEMLRFDAPAVEAIGTTRPLASPSPTVYYAIPKSSTTDTDYDCGFTFHVTYELISTTGERITVHDATVHVPSDKCNWVSNTSYTYVFRITKNSNGTTVTPGENDIDPTSPDVTTEDALYPIVFDNCTVTDYVEDNSDWNITDGTNVTLYSVVLGKTSINNNNDGTIKVTLKKNNGDLDGSGQWSVTGPTDAGVLSVTSGTITIPADQQVGIYTVTYTLDATEQTKYPNQPKTYSAQFEVVQNFNMNLSTTEIGTGGKDATNFTITTTDKFGGSTPKLTDLSIVYPDGWTADQKSKVNITEVSDPTTISVARDATPGTYKLKYGDGSATATTKEVSFEVKDFGFTLSKASVGLSTTSQTVSVTATNAPSSVTSTYTYSIAPESAGVTIEGTTGEITVTPSATAQTYTVKRTVNCNGSETTYERPLEVQNVYELSLDKYVVDNDVDTSITVTAKKNGADAMSNVAVSGSLTCSSGTISITSDTPTGTYTVTLKDGETEVKKVTFIVQD